MEQFCQLDEVGIFHPEAHVELLSGEILVMPRVSPAHALASCLFIQEFYDRLKRRCVIRTKGPIEIERHSVPLPDAAVIPYDRNRRCHPKPEDVFLLVEIADDSLAYDREVKLPVYARAGIREYWIMNLIDDVVESFGAQAVILFATLSSSD